MAKSKSFFDLRTGSTKTLTFQIFRGQQITKDRVYCVSNPRSNAQMSQRALIPIVAAARLVLKDLVDHSFEGVPYGEASLKEFSKLNLRAGALSVTSYSPNGVSNPGFADLIVSNGSIILPYSIEYSTDRWQNSIRVIGKTQFPAFEFPKLDEGASADAIFKYLENYARTNNVAILAPGTQLSFLSIYQSGSVKVSTGNGTIDVPTSGFYLDRIYIPNGDSDSENAKEINDKWKVHSPTEQGKNSVSLENSNGDILQIACWGPLIMKLQPKVAKIHNNCGIALILSRYENGVWKRSPARLTIGNVPTNKYTFEDWLSTYQTTGAASKKYLNTGDEGTGIQG